MKKIALILIVAASFAACSGKENKAAIEPVVVVDTAAIQRNAILAVQAQEKAVQDSTRIAQNAVALAAAKQKENNRVVRHRTRTNSSSSNTNNSDNVGSSETPSNSGSNTVTETTTDKKKGWSDAATGTAIGAGAGGLAGAIIDHGKGRGAIIGGLVGAGAGYIIGRKKDVKSGRVVKKTTTPTPNEAP